MFAPSEPQVEKAKPDNKAPELCTFSNSASDATAAQPSSTIVTIWRGTSQRAVETLEDTTNARAQQSSEAQGASRDGAQSETIGADRPSAVPKSLSQLSACVRSPTATAVSAPNSTPGVCVCKVPQPSLCKADADPSTDIVISQGGCCGPVTRKEIDLNKLSYNYEALDNGLAGLPHDVVQ